MPVVEIASIPASEAFLADLTLIDGPVANIVGKAEGFISAYVGLQIEDQKTAYLIVLWESLEAHQKLIGDPIYPTLISQLAPAVAGALKLQHVEFTGDVAIAFGAPVTEVAVSKLREGKSKEDVDTFMPVMVEASKVPPVAHGPCAYGEVIEEPGTFYLVLGWDSPEAHRAVTGVEGPGKEVVKKFREIVDLESMVHVKFTKVA
ncbi:hypothetical protein FA13DRAFT_1723994 [Coprinellus micaceus]|uniref:ABM domain-containing protein n=1 Tax=Coprinellus micaceus TaxID=71717 RepID=A0A4Y7U0J5_COPMI|nr:hypothetical protein FA13DRAFT_1723994 [Coprinellus micaceus]